MYGAEVKARGHQKLHESLNEFVNEQTPAAFSILSVVKHVRALIKMNSTFGLLRTLRSHWDPLLTFHPAAQVGVNL